MSVPALLLGLAAAAGGSDAPPQLDLKAIHPCARNSDEDIVVCGSRDGRSPYRLPKLSNEYERKPLRAQARIGGTDARAHVQSSTRRDGLVDKRIMITFSAPF